jgi:predicted class III extradiol MEMO1 family dioxygenase
MITSDQISGDLEEFCLLVVEIRSEQNRAATIVQSLDFAHYFGAEIVYERALFAWC